MTTKARKFATRAASAAGKAAKHMRGSVQTIGLEAKCPYGCGGTMSLAAGVKTALLHSEPACPSYAALRSKAGAAMSILGGLATLLGDD